MATQPRFLFHIGSHKTGTTYLQSAFRALTPSLSARGVHVPEQWYRNPRLGGHHQLPLQLIRGDVDALSRDMAQVMQTDRPDVLISAEGLSLLRERQIEKLRAALDGAEARFVFYCRRWSDFLPSYWQTLIRSGRHVPWPQFYRQVITEPADNPALNFTPRLSIYARLFGPEAISIVSYSNAMDTGQNLAIHFLETFLPHTLAHISADDPAFRTQPNASLPVWQTEIVRFLNAILHRHGHPPGSGPRAWLMQQAPRLDLDDLRAALVANQKVLTINDTAPALQALHARLFRDWGGRLTNPTHPNLLFEPRAREVPFIHPTALRDRDAAWLAHEVLHQYCRDNGVSLKRTDRAPADHPDDIHADPPLSS